MIRTLKIAWRLWRHPELKVQFEFWSRECDREFGLALEAHLRADHRAWRAARERHELAYRRFQKETERLLS